MKKVLFIFVSLFLFSYCAMAQEKVQSINIGFSPYGMTHAKISLSDEKYKYDYKSYWNVNAAFEKQLYGVLSLTEVSYSKAKFDEYDLKGTSDWFNPAQEEDLSAYSLTQYIGWTINPNKRVQFPLYVGVGFESLQGGALHNLLFDIAAKARVKFYITDAIGVYVGASGKIGWGNRHASESKSSNKTYYSVSGSTLFFDAGVLIGI